MTIDIKTKHLYLRLLKPDDLPYMVALNSDPEVMQFFPGGAQNKEQIEKRINEFIAYYKNNGLPCFVVFSLESEEFIGRCGFGLIETGEIEAGYLLQKEFWGQGYASEALAAILEWAKTNIKSEYIIAFTPIDHIASQRVMLKCGMEHYKNDIAKGVQCCFYRIKNSTD